MLDKIYENIHHILSNGDTVTIVTAQTVQANYDWFRHIKTASAINSLIDYFKQLNQG